MSPLFIDRQAVFFDFDGVIVDSHHVKTRAFAALYAEDHPQVVDRVIAYHNANGGVSRHRKFEYFESALLGREPTPARLTVLAERFAAAVVDAVVASPEIEGAEALLQALARQRTPCVVASGTPEDELRLIVERRGLSRYFHAIRGAPTEKSEILAQTIGALGCDPGACLMVGDAMTDYDAACATGVPFLGVAPLGAPSPFPACVRIVSSFTNSVGALA